MSKEKKERFERNNLATADFINCSLWGKGGEVLTQYVGKGNNLAVKGRLDVSSYETETGEKKYVTKVIVDEFKLIDFKNNDSEYLGQYDESDIPF